MSKYSTGGKGHTVLLLLMQEPTSHGQIAEYLGMSSRQLRQKVWHMLGNMLFDGLIGGGAQRYYVTHEGEHALRALAAGQDFHVQRDPKPSVRLFA